MSIGVAFILGAVIACLFAAGFSIGIQAGRSR
jgi:hypothetical protein